MRSVLAALVLVPAAVNAAISITGPSSSEYWVQNTSKTITWTYSAGDPTPVDIVLYNENNTTLNGNFTIAQYINVSALSYTLTNVTLVVGNDYGVEFVNPANHSQIYATSQLFSVMAAGTAAAPTSSASPSASSSAPATGSGSASASSATSPSSSGTSTATKSAARRAVSLENVQTMFGVIAACGIATVSALLL